MEVGIMGWYQTKLYDMDPAECRNHIMKSASKGYYTVSTSKGAVQSRETGQFNYLHLSFIHSDSRIRMEWQAIRCGGYIA
jgi:hypothetical protein